MAELQAQLLETLKAEGDPRALGNGAIFDTYEYVKPSPKDYEVWLAGQDESLSAEAERLSAVKKPKPRLPREVKP